MSSRLSQYESSHKYYLKNREEIIYKQRIDYYKKELKKWQKKLKEFKKANEKM